MSAEEIVETAVEEVADFVNEGTFQLTKGAHYVQLGIMAAAGAAVGGAIVYKVTKHRLETKYDQILTEQVAAAKEFYSTLNKKEGFETPQKAVKKLIPEPESDPAIYEATEALLAYQGNQKKNDPADIVVVEEERSVNVFVENTMDEDDNFDLEEEMANRSPDHPYVIHHEEFMASEAGFDQSTITYYVGDGSLADERDQEIPHPDPIIGEDNLSRFGHGSGDPRIVYIRNEKLSMDFEVVRHDGKYSHEVLGLMHSDGSARDRQRSRQPRRFRGDDE